MQYSWVILTLISAFALATSDALAKKAVRGNNEYIVAMFRLIFTLPLLLLMLPFIQIPELDRDFYKAFFIALPVELITIVLYIKALKVSDLSMTLPFLALTPVFLIFVSYFLLDEKVSVLGGTGIILIASGSYILNISEAKKGVLKPLKAITKEKGSLMMIGVALLYSITSSMGKMAIEHSSPLFFGITYFIALNLFFLPVGLWMGRRDMAGFIKEKKYTTLILPGLFYAIMVITHMVAMKLTKVAYMISLKRTSLIIGVLYGHFLFREEKIKDRLAGAVLMVAGFAMIVTAK